MEKKRKEKKNGPAVGESLEGVRGDVAWIVRVPGVRAHSKDIRGVSRVRVLLVGRVVIRPRGGEDERFVGVRGGGEFEIRRICVLVAGPRGEV